MPEFEPVIGLEIHAQLSTKSKIFCSCSTEFGAEPNTNVCPVCLGFPGVLPVLNRKVVEFAVLMGLATNCQINRRSTFERKNYFYPDLPKGYQISQYEHPICKNGYIVLTDNGVEKKIRLNRIHIEEDAGKSIHMQGNKTYVDANRCGVPLIEIVTEPDISSPREAYLFLQIIRQLVRYLEICDGNMEEGSLRCDANVSVRLKGTNTLGTKTEIKNMNSIRNVERALTYEIARQIDLLSDGLSITQETLLWNADKQIVETMRNKEESNDYRYFPDPDLVPIELSDEEINSLKKLLPELPNQKKERFINQYSIPAYNAEILTQSKDIANYFEEAGKFTKNYKNLSNWIITDVLKEINEKNITIDQFNLQPESLAELVNLIDEGKISIKIAKDIFEDILKTGKKPADIIKEKNLVQITDTSQLEEIINSIIEKNANAVAEYRAGKQKLLGFFVGEVMKQTKGKANPQIVNKILLEKLGSSNN